MGVWPPGTSAAIVTFTVAELVTRLLPVDWSATANTVSATASPPPVRLMASKLKLPAL